MPHAYISEDFSLRYEQVVNLENLVLPISRVSS